MNNDRRKKINIEIKQITDVMGVMKNIEIDRLNNYLEDVKNNIELICDDEQESFDNMPENLQYSMKGEKIEENINLMNDILNLFDDIIDAEEVDREEIEYILDEIIGLLNDVIYG